MMKKKSLNICSFKTIIKNLVEIIMYALFWYAMTNENLIICSEIVCYEISMLWYEISNAMV